MKGQKKIKSVISILLVTVMLILSMSQICIFADDIDGAAELTEEALQAEPYTESDEVLSDADMLAQQTDLSDEVMEEEFILETYGASNEDIDAPVEQTEPSPNSLPSALNIEGYEIFTDDCADFNKVFEKKGSVASSANKDYDIERMKGDATRFRGYTATVPPPERWVTYKVPNEKSAVKGLQFWTYYSGTAADNLKYRHKIWVSADNVDYTLVTDYALRENGKAPMSNGSNGYRELLYYAGDLSAYGDVRYVRIEFTAGNDGTAGKSHEGELGKVQLLYESNYAVNPISLFGESMVDLFNNLDKTDATTNKEGFVFKTEDAKTYSYDSSRITAKSNGAALVYNAPQGSRFTDLTAWVYSDAASGDISFEISADGSKYTSVDAVVTASVNNSKEKLYSIKGITPDSKWLKIIFNNTAAQLGRLELAHSEYKYELSQPVEIEGNICIDVTNRGTAPIDPVIIVASYDNENHMTAISLGELPEEGVIASGDKATLKAEKVSNGKAFVVDSLSTMLPLERAKLDDGSKLEITDVSAPDTEITIKGSVTAANGETLNVLLLKADASSNENTVVGNLSVADKAKIAYAGQFENINGDFTVSFKIDSKSNSGYYYGVVASNGDVKPINVLFINENEKGEVIGYMNKTTTAADLQAYFDGPVTVDGAAKDYRITLKGLGLDLEAYELLSAAEKTTMGTMMFNIMKKTPFTQDTLKDSFNKSLEVIKINRCTTAEALEAAIINAKEIFGFDDTKTKFGAEFAAMTEDEKDLFYDVLLESVAFDGYVELAQAFNDGIVITKFSCETYDKMESLLDKYKSELKLDNTLYNKYKNKLDIYEKAIVDKALVPASENSRYASLGAIKNVFETETGKFNNTVSGPIGGGGGGGGGGAPAIVPNHVADPVTTEPDPELPTVDFNIKFYDLNGVEWAEENIEYLVKEGVIAGYDDGSFKPNQTVTREEFVKMLVSAFKLTDENATCSFTDVKSGDWAEKYIATAYNLGIVTGTSETTFGYGLNITREDMAVMALNALKLNNRLDVSTELTFSDSDEISNYAKDAVATLYDMEVIGGMGNNTFAPKEMATRAQAARIIHLLIQVK